MSVRKKFLVALMTGSMLVFSAACSSSPKKESTGEYLDDSVITTKVKSAFVADPVVSAMAIKVETFKGVVQLSGFANSPAEKKRAGELAKSTKGVTDVKNDIIVK